MKIFSAQQIRDWDKYTIENEPISSTALMERAATQCTRWVCKNFSREHEILVIAGKGNNGGDGLAMCRQLLQVHYNVKCYVLNFSDTESQDFKINLERLRALNAQTTELRSPNELSGIETKGKPVIIDAIFGTGLSRIPEGLAAESIQWMNEQEATRISLDIPSGMFCDLNKDNTHSAIVEADHTLSFGCPKLSFLLPTGGNRTGKFEIMNIGLHRAYYDSCDSIYYFYEAKDLIGKLKSRAKFSHKGFFGHVQLITGSYGKTGASIMAAKASVETGAGLTSIHCPQCSTESLQNSVPEAMVRVNAGQYFLEGTYEDEGHSIGIGPGIGTNEETKSFVSEILDNIRRPIVLDADALNILASDDELLQKVPEGSILTPHPKEFERLVGKWTSESEKLEKLKQLANNNKIFVVLKGAHTAICTPDSRVYFNSTGNAGMAKGGSGDILTGIITSLLAQKYDSEEACLIGVYLHGRAGDLCLKEKAIQSISPIDIIDKISDAILDLENTKQ